jgi:hypothetical protein
MANEFYTLTTLGTLAGATGATVTVANTFKSLCDVNPRWLGFATAQAVCLGVLFAAGAQHQSDWFVAVLNGCLVHLAAAGTSATGAAAFGGGGGASGAGGGAVARGEPSVLAESAVGKPKRKFWMRWY